MKVKFNWFKSSGKWYSEHEQEFIARDIYEVLENIKALLDSGIRPGLINGHQFNCLVEIDGQQHLFVRGQNINV